MTTKSYKYFIFDLDGTLVDSSPSIYASIRHTEQQLGLTPVPQEQLHRFVGPPLAASFREFYGADDAQVGRMLQTYRAHYTQESYSLTSTYPGVPELLQQIRDSGCHAAVATLKNRVAAGPTMEHSGLGGYFDLIAALEDNSVKTKADLIGDCLDYYGHPPREQAVFFGDSPYDGVGAQESGVDFVALTYGFGFLEPGSLEGIPFVLKATDPLQLVEFVKEATKA